MNRFLAIAALSVGLASTAACSSDSSGLTGRGRVDVRDEGVARPGVSATELHVGFVYVTGLGSASKAAGAATDIGDPKAGYQALVEDINRRGGVHGRKLVAHFRPYDTSSPDGPGQEQANCSALTQDAEVFAVFAPNRQSETFKSCVEDAGSVYVGWGGSSAADDRLFEQYPHYAEAGSLSVSRSTPFVVDRLVAQRVLDADSRIGVVVADSPGFVRAYDDELLPALRQHGLEVAIDVRVPVADTAAGMGETNAAVQAAVLQLRNKGVDRVLFLQNGVALPYLFMHGAHRQQYQPRYAVSTSEGPSSLADQVPAAQLEGAVGVGWLPVTDLAFPEWELTPPQERCLELLGEAGVELPDRMAQTMAFALCEQVQVFAAAAEAAGPELTNRSWVQGLEALGDSVPSALTFRLAFGSGRHDGVAAARDLAFEKGCRCFRYTGPARAVP